MAAALAALAVAGVGAWAAFGRGGGVAPAARRQRFARGRARRRPARRRAPASAVGRRAAPTLGRRTVGQPDVGRRRRRSPSPRASLIPLPHGVGHFAAAPAPRMVAGPRRRSVPILMYHLIGNPPAGEPYPDLFVSLSDFVRADALPRGPRLHRRDAARSSSPSGMGKGRLPAKPVVLSFDDGYRSDWRVAAPILQRIGWPGVLNLCLNAVRPHGDLPAPLVRGLVRAGWEIDDHTLTHPDLTTLDAAGLHREIVVSRASAADADRPAGLVLLLSVGRLRRHGDRRRQGRRLQGRHHHQRGPGHADRPVHARAHQGAPRHGPDRLRQGAADG